MAVRNVLTMGDERLLRVAQPVTRFDSPELRALLADMRETMEVLDGAGLAAPQIGVALRVVIFGVASNPRYPDAEPVPGTVLINPTLTALSADLEDGWEGCLSVPGMRGLVPRFKSVHYSGYDEHGTFFERSVTDFHARVVQHEVDHLDGVLYPLRIRDLRNFGFSESLFGAHVPSVSATA
jgi:peptide deformylase